MDKPFKDKILQTYNMLNKKYNVSNKKYDVKK